MAQTNDDLLYSKPKLLKDTRYSKEKYLYINGSHLFRCVTIDDIIQNPSLIAQLTLPSVSIVVLTQEKAQVFLPHRPLSVVVDRTTFLCRKVGTVVKAVYEKNNEIYQLKYNNLLHPLFLLSAEELNSQYKKYQNN